MEEISVRRNRLYNKAMIASVIFGVIALITMTIFRINGAYFTEKSRFGLLADGTSTKEPEVSYPKINIKVDFKDGGDKSLVIPLETPVDIENISVREEFTENKYVITLSEYGENITGALSLVGDLDIMDAAGAYTQNENVVVEVYCNNNYDYDIALDNSAVTINFYDVDSIYDYKAVLWLPFSDKSRLSSVGLKQELMRFTQENGIKLYMTSELEDEYSQNDIIDFANGIMADMVIGIETETSKGTTSYMTGICNPLYFMPDYDSARLAVNLVEEFAHVLNFEVNEFIEQDTDYPIVYKATVPSAVIRLSLSESEIESDLEEYNFNENIVIAIENTINSALAEWSKDNEDK
jgi:hypothetical protein